MGVRSPAWATPTRYLTAAAEVNLALPGNWGGARSRTGPDQDRYLPCTEPEGGTEGIGSPRGPPRGPPRPRRDVWRDEADGKSNKAVPKPWGPMGIAKMAKRTSLCKTSFAKTCDGKIAIFRLIRTRDRPGFHPGLICNESCARYRTNAPRTYGGAPRFPRQRLHFCERPRVRRVAVHARAPPTVNATK
jgi:hypothetical protein